MSHQCICTQTNTGKCLRCSLRQKRLFLQTVGAGGFHAPLWLWLWCEGLARTRKLLGSPGCCFATSSAEPGFHTPYSATVHVQKSESDVLEEQEAKTTAGNMQNRNNIDSS